MARLRPAPRGDITEAEGGTMPKQATSALILLTLMAGCEATSMSTKSEAKPEAEPEPEASETTPETTAPAELHVEVFYRERMRLPPTAILEVTLEDSAKMDVAAEQIAKTSMALHTAPPYRVTLEYDASKLHRRGRYGVRARIENDGRLMFISTEFNPAYGEDGAHSGAPHDPVKVLVQRVTGAPRTGAASITGTRWVLQTLRGKEAGVGAGGQAPFFTLQGAEPRVSGFAGCNRFTGGYQLESGKLSFSQLAMTMKACLEGMELEREVAKVLEQTRTFQLSGNRLELQAEDGTPLATLQPE
jgi:putative lipoprotein